MERKQSIELWNCRADRKNLSIHHALKVIRGWEKVPRLAENCTRYDPSIDKVDIDIDHVEDVMQNRTNVRPCELVLEFLDEWRNAIMELLIKNKEYI